MLTPKLALLAEPVAFVVAAADGEMPNLAGLDGEGCKIAGVAEMSLRMELLEERRDRGMTPTESGVENGVE